MILFCFMRVLIESLLFFFSSRRRHTRYIGDWSSDVCSSDLADTALARASGISLRDRDCREARSEIPDARARAVSAAPGGAGGCTAVADGEGQRSEERRVGEEWRARCVAEVCSKERGGVSEAA